jgi:oxygen-independent coproporphyrinogen-3 oxidase
MSGLYLHIPFCKKACTYCDFHFSTSLQTKPAVLEAMHKELAQRAAELNGAPVETIYFGGGTPSQLTDTELKAFIDEAQALFTVTPDAEVTMEVNPDDVDAERLAAWKAIGITRLSIGVQSFREERLQFMGRAHDATQSRESLRLISEADFASWTMDLIYGLPGMTMDEWNEQLETALSFAPPHISAYCLTVESRTALDHQVSKGLVTMPGDADQAAQFDRLIERLEGAGYVQYEISNFGKPDHFSQHNSSYWKGVPYLGIGPSAHSYNGEKRRWNVSHNLRYAKGVTGGERYWEEETLTQVQVVNETLLTRLRTIWGVDLAALILDVETPGSSVIARYRSQGMLEQHERRLVLTRAGRAFADRIASDLFLSDDR